MARTRYSKPNDNLGLRDLPAAALRAVLREGYGLKDLRADILAGMVVRIVALPLAMALAIAVGVAPQHGLYTAIIAGVVVAALGGSRTQVTGPTAAFVVILAPIYIEFGTAGLLVSGLLAGVLLLLMGLLRLGKLIEFIPHPVTTGFTAGIGTVIAVLQLKDLFGLTLAGNPEHFVERVQIMYSARHTACLAEAMMGLTTLLALILLPRVTRRVPAPLIALPLAALAAFALPHLIEGFSVVTIADRFQTVVEGKIVRGIPAMLPMPSLPWRMPGGSGNAFVLDYHTLRQLLPGAFAIATLAAIESLLSAVVADGMAGTKHDPDAELVAVGIGNIVTPFLGGIPATGAIARTATNIRSGARSPVASHRAQSHDPRVHLGPCSSARLPPHGLARGAFASRCLEHVRRPSLRSHPEIAPRSDVAVLLTCFFLTVAFDMVIGVSVGIVLAAFMFMRRMAEVSESSILESEHPDVPAPLPPGVIVYEISGPLFFGAAQKAMTTLHVIAEQTSAVVFLMGGVQALDVTGLVALESALDELRRRGCCALLCGLRKQPLAMLKRAGLDRNENVELHAHAQSAVASIIAKRALTQS